MKVVNLLVGFVNPPTKEGKVTLNCVASKILKGSISMICQISHKIETYQLEGLVEDGTLAHHAINILSKGGSHFKLKK